MMADGDISPRSALLAGQEAEYLSRGSTHPQHANDGPRLSKRAKVCSTVAIVVGAVLIAAGIAISEIIHSKLVNRSDVSSPDAPGFAEWHNNTQSNSIPLHYWVHFFNITNPYEVLKGAKPKLQELPPFKLREYDVRFDMTWTVDGDIVSFYEWSYYVPEDDSGEQMVTTLNLPYLILLNKGLGGTYDFDNDFDRLFVTKKAKDIYFGFYETTLPPPLSMNITLPGFVHNYTSMEEVRSIRGKNIMYTGKYAPQASRRYIAWDGMPSLLCCFTGPCNKDEPDLPPPFDALSDPRPGWATEEANQISGTFGDQFQPNLEEGTTIDFWVETLFRVAPLKNVDNVHSEVKGIDTLHFSIDPYALQNSSVNPANAPYYMNTTGLFDTSRCEGGIPVGISLPYYLDGDERLKEHVEFLNGEADVDQHKLYVNIQPLLGTTLEAHQRSQINLRVEAKNISFLGFDDQTVFKDVSPGYIPVAWVDRWGQVNDDLASELRMALGLRLGLLLGGTIAGGLLLLAGIGTLVCKGRKNAKGARQNTQGRSINAAGADRDDI